MSKKLNEQLFKKQKGVVLVVALIMLLVMTSIGITLMSGATLQERMAGNNRQLTVARANAQAAIAIAEAQLENMAIQTRDDVITNITGTGFYIDVGVDQTHPYSTATSPMSTVLDLTDESNWTAGTNAIAASAVSTDGPSPMYMVEYIGRMKYGELDTDIDVGIENQSSVSASPFVFRITALGYDNTGNISAVLQTTYSTGD